ncbi:MAG: bifunctional hydroxymethylpyrimidine kinase/phosphomethylpyrimidine kinase [Verrucomicrobiota bacterium]
MHCALTIAGSDCSSGAGIQADLKTFQHFRIHGLTAVTCVVSETAELVNHVHPVPVEILRDQISLLFSSFPVAAVKTGMLFSAGHVRATAETFRSHPDVKLVVDPVMIASSGSPLLEPDAIAVYEEKLLPLATLITPNLPEAEHLSGWKISSEAGLEAAAIALSEKYRTAILVKGGHLDSADCLDILAIGNTVHHFRSPRIATTASHGTGCTLSAAITALLALGHELPAAIAKAKAYLEETLRHSYTLGSIPCLNQGTTF